MLSEAHPVGGTFEDRTSVTLEFQDKEQHETRPTGPQVYMLDNLPANPFLHPPRSSHVEQQAHYWAQTHSPGRNTTNKPELFRFDTRTRACLAIQFHRSLSHKAGKAPHSPTYRYGQISGCTRIQCAYHKSGYEALS